MVLTPAVLPSMSQPAPVALQEVPSDQVTEEEKTWSWFTNGSAGYAGTTQKWAAVYIHEGSDRGRSSQWAELKAVHLVTRFAWKEKWPDE